MQSTDLDVAGLRVLVTGASSGIGAATAMAFAGAGAHVGICARRTDRLEEVATSCRASGARTDAWTVDLSDLDAITPFAERVLDDMSGVDILVNNAGAGRRKRMQAVSVREFDETMDLNFGAPMRLTLALLPQMLERDSGHVVNVGSSGTREFAPTTGAYVAAKAALDAFTEALYIDLAATGVRSHLIVPGMTATEFSTARPDQEPPFPVDPDRLDSPETVAAAILGCLSTDDFETYPTDRVRAACKKKRADFNGYLRTRREWFRA